MKKLSELDFSIVQQCMHCGLCLPHCPTYLETLNEKNSPRGRISLMRQISLGNLELNKNFADEMSYCLGCVSCQANCPAGVDYTTLFETSRSSIEEAGINKNPFRKAIRHLFFRIIFQDLRKLRFLARTLRLFQSLKLDRALLKLQQWHLFPKSLANLVSKAPRIQNHFTHELLREHEKPTQARHKVLLLSGCVQDISYSHVNRDTMEVLVYHDCEVITPAQQHCCGSLHVHNGDAKGAEQLARKNLDMMDSLEGIDAIISNAGGCGSHLKHYDSFLADDQEYAAKARVWSHKVKDIHEWLFSIGIKNLEASPFTNDSPKEKLCYHQACHLCHAQGIKQEPIALLKSMGTHELVPLKEADLCCGSAGIYSLTQPETAQNLKQRKLENIKNSGAQVVAVANPGCHAHLSSSQSSDSQGESMKFVHPVSLYAEQLRKLSKEAN